MKPRLLTLLVGATLSLLVLCSLHSQDGPTILYPWPALVLVPSILFHLRWAAVAVPAVLFLAWNPGLSRGDREIPRRSYISLAVAAALSVVWFLVGWKDGLVIQGAKYTYSVALINIIWMGLLSALSIRSRRTPPSFEISLLLHWLLFAWLAWYAFPFFGEIT